MDSGTLTWGAPLFLAAIGVGALATGRIGLGGVLDASDARLARWLIGALALAGAVVVAVIEPAPLTRLPAIALGVAGAWMIVAAIRHAPSDRSGGIVGRAITGSASAGPMRWRSRPDGIATDRLGPMANQISAPRGTRDLLPEEAPAWDRVEAVARDLGRRYAFERIETPLFERVELFARGLGESSDAVEKEMFRVAGAKGSEEEAAPWALRPEPTAGIVRAFIEHGMHVRPGPLRLTLIGPMFRYDRPQAGRFRQFSQWDVEVIGDAGPAVDAELVELGHRFYAEVGLTDVVARLNSIGDAECRPRYREALVAYFEAHEGRLTDDSRRRLRINPLRVLDDKELAADLAAGAPRAIDHLCDACREHFDGVRSVLDGLGVRYELAHRLVRGLDYYTRTAFEFYVAGRTGQQQALGGGGRYDGLVELLGGRPTAGIGFGIGLDRTVLAMEEQGVELPQRGPLVAVVSAHDDQVARLGVAAGLRERGLSVRPDGSIRKLGRQLESAAKAGARWAVIIGDVPSQLALKDLASGEQRDGLSLEEVVAAVSE